MRPNEIRENNKKMLITSIKKCCKYQFLLYLYKVNKKNKQMENDLTRSSFNLYKVQKIGRTNKSKKIVRIEDYKEKSFNAVLRQISKTDRAEKQRNERRAKR